MLHFNVNLQAFYGTKGEKNFRIGGSLLRQLAARRLATRINKGWSQISGLN
jgi:hypothetical protein